ncbi:hypothetical protein SteCoe_16634 [Stentor coeruleus]|uniref:Uncharacterized protein n=1 Tax=Stentor coeruleus TaxID=5963 RepID=A0A1R2C0P3_9CILI|nr:hypothetical protein SteCoe_16634 [Stentor coeruleus]
MKKISLFHLITKTDSTDYDSLTKRTTKNICINKSILKKVQDARENIDPILNILCINCQDLISEDLIDHHSKMCVAMTDTVMNIEGTYSIEEWIYKIHKLKKCLETLIKKTEIKPGDKNTMIILIRIMTNVSSDYTENILTRSIKSLNSITSNFRGTLTIRVYVDRLQYLLNSLFITVQSENRLNTLSIEQAIEEKNCEIQQLKIKTEYYKSQSENLENIVLRTNSIRSPLRKRIDEVDSDLGSRSDQSRMSTLNNELSLIIHDEEKSPGINKFAYTNDDDLQKYFYSLCLSLKIKYCAKDKNKSRLSNQKMYKEVKETKIPPEEWYDYISSQFENPESRFIEGPPRRAN